MKIIGLIGGMSWESTTSYYQLINQRIKEKLGGLNSAKCILYSVNFEEIEKYQALGQWEESGKLLSDVASTLEKAGAEVIILCTNTMHKVTPQILDAINIPFIHIAEATAQELKTKNITKVALLGTKYTMTQDFYKSKLENQHIEVLIPNNDEIEYINKIIYDELCLGIISEKSKLIYLEIINSLTKKGAQGVILGCTEIGLLIKQQDTDIPIFDTTYIHAIKVADYSIE